jgi:hypothetical protein
MTVFTMMTFWGAVLIGAGMLLFVFLFALCILFCIDGIESE